jgi:hypothetical protein
MNRFNHHARRSRKCKIAVFFTSLKNLNESGRQLFGADSTIAPVRLVLIGLQLFGYESRSTFESNIPSASNLLPLPHLHPLPFPFSRPLSFPFLWRAFQHLMMRS